MIRPWITLLLPGKSKISSRQAQQAKDRRLKTLEQLRWGFTASSPYCRCHSCFCCCLLCCFRWQLVLAVDVERKWQEMVAMLDDGGGWACCGRQEKRDWQEGGEVEEAEQEKKVKKEEMVVDQVPPVRWRSTVSSLCCRCRSCFYCCL